MSRIHGIVVAALAMVLGSAGIARSQQACPPGMAVSEDTGGNCCWPGQAWSKGRKACVGIPACPAGMRAEAESCVTVCPAGQLASEETRGHCCWPAQVWSGTRQICVGIPTCPAGLHSEGENCVAACPDGQVRDEETRGHCCWPSQAWSGSRQVCVGIPTCPAGATPEGEVCAWHATPVMAPPPPPSPIPAPTQIPATPPPPPRPVVEAPAQNGQNAPAQGEVPVMFAAENDRRRLTISVNTPSGDRSCQAPCTLNLPPGKLRLKVSGDMRMERDFVVPVVPAKATLMDARRGGSIGGGIALVALGALPTTFAFTLSHQTQAQFYALLATGCLCFGVGLTMVITGAAAQPSVALAPAYNSSAAPESAPRLVGLGLAPTAHGAVAGALFAF